MEVDFQAGHDGGGQPFAQIDRGGLVGEPELQDVIRNFEASAEGKAAEAEAEAEANSPD